MHDKEHREVDRKLILQEEWIIDMLFWCADMLGSLFGFVTLTVESTDCSRRPLAEVRGAEPSSLDMKVIDTCGGGLGPQPHPGASQPQRRSASELVMVERRVNVVEHAHQVDVIGNLAHFIIINVLVGEGTAKRARDSVVPKIRPVVNVLCGHAF